MGTQTNMGENMPDDRAIQIILTLLASDRAMTPSEMLLEVRRGGIISQADAKEAISYLLNNQDIDLTPNRLLRSNARAA